MQGKNNQTTIQTLIAIIICLSMVIVFIGIFYILNMQSKLEKLETEQEEQLKKQIETQNMASVQSVPDIQQIQKTRTNSVTPKNSNPKISPRKKVSTYITKSTSGPVNVREKATIDNQTENKKISDEVLEKCKNYFMYSNYSDYEIEKAIKAKYYIRMNPPTFSEFDKMKALQESTNAKLEASEEIMNAKNCKAMINKWKK